MTAARAIAPLAEPDPLAAALRRDLPGFGAVDWTAQTGSTNADLLGRTRRAAPPPLPWLMGAHLQTGGRGRAGRAWHNQAGHCLMFSCAFFAPVPLRQLPALSPLAGLAATEALRERAGPARADLRVKWPNDLHFQGRKLAGILVETGRLNDSNATVVVIGMGLNLTQAGDLSAELARGIADWSQICGQAGEATSTTPTVAPALASPSAVGSACAPTTEPARLVAAVAQAWHDIISDCATAGFAGLRERYVALDTLLGHEVNVTDQGALLFHGIAQDYDDDGRLLVRTATGVQAVSVGDVSVRLRG